jgi:hypothetical protein
MALAPPPRRARTQSPRGRLRRSPGRPTSIRAIARDVAQLGSAPALGAGGPGFKSPHPDHLRLTPPGGPHVVARRTGPRRNHPRYPQRAGTPRGPWTSRSRDGSPRASPALRRRTRSSRIPRRHETGGRPDGGSSGPPEADAAPGALAAPGTGHPVVEAAPGQPDPQRELEDEQIEHTDVRRLTTARTLHGEGTSLVERIPRRHRQAVWFGTSTRVERALAHGQRHGRHPFWGSRCTRRRHPEQGALPEWIRRFVAPRAGHAAQAVCIAS